MYIRLINIREDKSIKKVSVKTEGLTKRYPGRKNEVLKDVNLTVQEGNFVAILGPSGCGKSTLLNIIGGIDKPNAGIVQVEDLKLTNLSENELTRFRRNKIGFIFQFFNLLPTFTVFENICLPLEVNGFSEKEKNLRANELIERLGLGSQKNVLPAQLSGGEMQRTAIARAIIHRPSIVLADEPTGNLDSENGKNVLNILKEINSHEKITIIMVTHSKDASECADTTFSMRDGQIENDQQVKLID